MIGAVADFVHADQLEAVQPTVIELVGDDALEDLPDGLPADPHQPGDLRLAHLLRQPRREILEIAGVPRARPRPRHMLVHIAAARAVQPPEPALDHAPRGAEIQRPPALLAVLLDLQATRPAARADRLLGAQHDGHDHRLLTERHIPDPCTRKPEHPVECGGDPHVALLRRQLNFRHPAACRRRAAAGRPARARLARPTRRSRPQSVADPRATRQAAAPISPAPRRNPHGYRPFGRLTRASGPLSGNDRRPGAGTDHINNPTAQTPEVTPKRRGVPHVAGRWKRGRARGGGRVRRPATRRSSGASPG